MEERKCGSCSLCCKIMGVPEIRKRPNVWCDDCDKHGGCRIYANRPDSCRFFDCLWLAAPEVPDDLRPDKVHVVMWCPPNDATVMAFRERPDDTFPRPDFVIQEDPAYYAIGESREHPKLGEFLELLLSRGQTLCFVNGQQRKMVFNEKGAR